MSGLRRALDGLYLAGGYIAAFFLIVLLLVIVAQMVARWSGMTFPGATAYAGYCMAAASFFALAHALNAGAHIRVSLLLNRLGRWRRYGEIWCLGLATLLSACFCWHAWHSGVAISIRFNEISQGQDATPVWIPQLAMGLGTTLLFIALADRLVRLLFCGRHGIVGKPGDG